MQGVSVAHCAWGTQGASEAPSGISLADRVRSAFQATTGAPSAFLTQGASTSSGEVGHLFSRPDLASFEQKTKRRHREEDDDDDFSESGSSTSDFKKIFGLVTSFFPGALPKEERPPPPSCVHEPLLGDSQERPALARFTLYDRITRVREDVSRRLGSVLEEGQKSTRLLRTRRGAYRVANDSSFGKPPVLGENFKRLCTSGVNTKANVSVPLEDLVKVEAALSAQQEMQSFAMWIISTIFAQVAGMELDPEEAELFKGFSSSLCLAMIHHLTQSLRLSGQFA